MKTEIITNNMLDVLRIQVKNVLSVNRFSHTLGVEETAAYIGAKLCPDKITELRVAALLHDITKELSLEKQLKICNEFGIILRDDEVLAPAIIHSITAAAIIPSKYPRFCSCDIISAVRWHTTGCADMSLFDKIICLSDYIEPNRQYEECRELRNYLKCVFSKEDDEVTLVNCLNSSLLNSFENTVSLMNASGFVAVKETFEAIYSLKKHRYDFC